MRSYFLFLIAGIVVLVAGCRRGTPTPPPPVAAVPETSWRSIPPASRVYYDNAGGIQDTLRLVVRDPESLRRIWQQATARQAAPPQVPEVDFSREMLLVVAAGRRTPEDQIQVDSVGLHRDRTADQQQREDVLLAVVRLIEGCRRLNIDAYPVEIVRVTRFDGPVRFVERREQAAGCGSPGE